MGTPFVLNMSVGWEDEPYGQPTGTLATEAVRALLRFVTCAGGINIAAAGNEREGPLPSTSAMLPAKFEASGSPSCAPGVTSYTPIVHGVGGLDGLQRPLASTREGGRPRLAGYALQVTADPTYWINGFPGVLPFDSPSLTGTSMSAALASAAAALVVYHDPGRLAADVMQALYDTGEPLPVPAKAEYCLGAPGSCPDIRRISVCAALEGVLGDGSLGCAPPPPGDPQWASGQAATASGLSDHTIVVATTAPYPIGECGGGYVLHTDPDIDAYPLFPCPDRQLYNYIIQPQVDPQPRGPGCDVCAFDPEAGLLTVLISDTLAGDGPIDDVRLMFTGPDGTTHAFEVGGPFSAGEVVQVSGIDTGGFVFDLVEMTGVVSGFAGRDLVRTEQIPIQTSGPAIPSL